MLTSPITITIDGVAHSLSRINNDNFGSTYLKKAAGLEIRLVVRNSYEKSSAGVQYERHNMDLTHTTWDVDGKPTTTQTYMVSRCIRGIDTKVPADVAKAAFAFGTANVAAVLGWES